MPSPMPVSATSTAALPADRPYMSSRRAQCASGRRRAACSRHAKRRSHSTRPASTRTQCGALRGRCAGGRDMPRPCLYLHSSFLHADVFSGFPHEPRARRSARRSRWRRPANRATTRVRAKLSTSIVSRTSEFIAQRQTPPHAVVLHMLCQGSRAKFWFCKNK